MAAESPAQIIIAAQKALRSAHGYVMVGNLTQGSQKMRLEITFGGSSKLAFRLSSGGGTASIIALPGGAYIKANKAYWKSNGGGAVVKYANRWIELPASYSAKLTEQLGQFNPKTLATCLAEDHGKLSTSGKTSTVSGKQVVVIRDAGGVPGGTPGTLAVAGRRPGLSGSHHRDWTDAQGWEG